MTARLWLRIGLWFLTIMQGAVGLWQLFLPHSFYADAPVRSHHWVDLLPPYNEHLMRDVGELTLAVAIVLCVAAVTLDRLLVRVGLSAYLLYTVAHFVFHATHLQAFPTGDAVGQTIALGIGVVLPAVLLPLTVRLRPRAARL
ncbi:MAG TPA: hypothetical protein VF053_16585 [Streptosporangiales bacterium]